MTFKGHGISKLKEGEQPSFLNLLTKGKTIQPFWTFLSRLHGFLSTKESIASKLSKMSTGETETSVESLPSPSGHYLLHAKKRCTLAKLRKPITSPESADWLACCRQWPSNRPSHIGSKFMAMNLSIMITKCHFKVQVTRDMFWISLLYMH